jgi:hypothetical protein
MRILTATLAAILICFNLAAAESDSFRTAESASYQIRCKINSNDQYSTFAVASGTAISENLFVSCAHLLDGVAGQKTVCQILINGKWETASILKYTSWKTNGDIDLSLFLLNSTTFPSYVSPGIISSFEEIDPQDLKFVGFGENSTKHSKQIEIKEFREAYGNYKPELITSYTYHHGDSGGGVFYKDHLVAVCKAKIQTNGVDQGGANCTNTQLIEFLYPKGTKERTDCYLYQGRQYCTPQPNFIYLQPRRNLQIGPVQNIISLPDKKPGLVNVPKTENPFKNVEVPQKNQDEICKPFKDKITELENSLEQTKVELNNYKNTYNTQLVAFNTEKTRIFNEKSKLEQDLIAARRFFVYFTVEADENCQETDVEAARIKEKGLNLVLVVMKKQDIAVNSVPRLFLMPQRQTVYGKTEVL